MDGGYSVVTTVYNDTEDFQNLIYDISHQTLKPVEVIVVDGGSSKESINYMKKVIERSFVSVKLICGQRLNISQGLNKAINSATSAIVMIVTTGNKYMSNCAELLFERIVQNNLDYSYCPIAGQESTEFAKKYNDVFLNGNKGLCQDVASNHGVMIKKSVFSKAGLFYENFVYAGEDAELFKKIREEGFSGEIVDEAIVFWDTPHNVKEYYKQVKNYTIAFMQMDTLGLFICREVYLVAYICIFAGLLFSYVGNVYFSPIFALILSIMNLKWLSEGGFNKLYLLNLSSVLKIFVYVRYCKYLLPKYKVVESRRNK